MKKIIPLFFLILIVFTSCNLSMFDQGILDSTIPGTVPDESIPERPVEFSYEAPKNVTATEAYYTDRIVRLWGKADMIIIWMASDWVSNYYDVKGVTNGGNGLLTKDTICKPAYYAIQFLNTLGGELLKKGDHYLITRKEANNYYILLFNYTALGGDYLIYEKGMEDPGQISMIYEGQSPMEIRISLKPMRADRYVIKRRTINPKEGSLLWEWRKFEFNNTLTSQEVKYIRQICFPRISLKKQETENGILEIQEKVGLHEIVLIHIYEERVS